MKLRKILTPILATAGSCIAVTPVVCLTSCSQTAEEKEIFSVADPKTKTVEEATTAIWEIEAVCAEAIPEDAKATVIIDTLGKNMDITQCVSAIATPTTLNIKIGYVTQEVSVQETTDFTTTFKLHFEWSEKVGNETKKYQQTIQDKFSLIYHVVKA